jgi:TPR repeat protein
MAKILFERAAQQGDVTAMYNLGHMHSEGQGVEQSYEKAKEYYEKAAQLGFADAQYALGRMYALGEGVSKDTMKAKSFWTTSSAQGNENAINGLKWLKQNT